MKLIPGEQNRAGTAAYAKGQATVSNILETAWRLAVDEGMAALTMRRIARELNISPGNLSYYYPTKQALLEALLTQVIDSYLEEFKRLRHCNAQTPEEALRAVIHFVLDDIGTRETTLFFPELWVLANRDAWASSHMERIYAGYRQVLAEIIGDFCACPDPEVHQQLALAISGSIEGQTVFIGHKRPHESRAGRIKHLVVEQSIALVRGIDSSGDFDSGQMPPAPKRTRRAP